MPEHIACPSCGQRFTLRPQLLGKRVRCAKCATTFTVPAAATMVVSSESSEAAYDVADAPALPPPPPPKFTPAAAPRPVPLDWTEAEKTWMKIGGSIALMGAVSLILPFFGLQFRKIAAMGENAPYVGIGLMILGAAIDGLVVIRHILLPGMAKAQGAIRVTRRVLKYGILTVAGVFLLMLAVAIWSVYWRSRSPQFQPVPRGPSGPPMVSPGPQPGSPPRDPGSISDRFGAQRTVKLIFNNTRGVDVVRDLEPKVRALLPKQNHGMRWRPGPDQVTFWVGPIDDIDALVTSIDFATVTKTDREQRELTLSFKPASTRPAR